MQEAHPGANPFGFPYDQYAGFRTEEQAASFRRMSKVKATKKDMRDEIISLRAALQRIGDERDDLLRKNKSLKSVVADLLAEADE